MNPASFAPVHVLGLAAPFSPDTLPPATLDLLRVADLVCGGRRLLHPFSRIEGARLMARCALCLSRRARRKRCRLRMDLRVRPVWSGRLSVWGG